MLISELGGGIECRINAKEIENNFTSLVDYLNSKEIFINRIITKESISIGYYYHSSQVGWSKVYLVKAWGMPVAFINTDTILP